MFKETREMIDSTVYTNGKGEVTAQNINLAFHGVIDATEEKITEVENKVAEIEENGTGGSGALRVWLNDASVGIIATPEQVEENIATYDALMLNGTQSVILTSSSTLDGKESVITYNPIMTKVTAADNQIQFTVALNFGDGLVDFTITLSSDGTII